MTISTDSLLRRIKTLSPEDGINRPHTISGPPTGGLDYTGASTGYNPGNNQTYAPPTFSSQIPNQPPPNYGGVDDFTFDSTYQTKWDALQRQLADAQQQYDLANQQDQPEYERVLRESGQQQEIDLQNLIDRMASQGTLRSGVAVKAQGDLGQSYQRRLADYERQRTQAKSSRDTNYSKTRQTINDSISLLQGEKTAREQRRQEEAARQQALLLEQQQPKVDRFGNLYREDAPVGIPGTPGINSGTWQAPTSGNNLGGDNPYAYAPSDPNQQPSYQVPREQQYGQDTVYAAGLDPAILRALGLI